ncbi:MAG: RIP metalloprotease RseP [Tidjanibacter sp.]|nr:RIP metalloprotease RseP [Tidjanibacter sp.]
MDILIKILQFVLSFSLLVIVHECGHFIFAKIFHVRVEQFHLFFGRPWVKWHWGETEYGIGWIPFGGFVKLAGMIDESLDTEQLKREPQPWEFRTKPAWQRLLIMIGGVVMNVILAFVIYVAMSYTWGDRYISNQNMPYGYAFNQMAEELGFRDGDHIVSIGGQPIDDYAQIMTSLLIDDDKTTVVERDGSRVTLQIPVQSVVKLAEQSDFILPRYPFVVGEVLEGSGAAEGGLRSGDKLIGIDHREARFFDQYQTLFDDAAGRTVELAVLRGVDTLLLSVNVSDAGKIGVTVDSSGVVEVCTRQYTLLQAIPAGFHRVGVEIGDYWKQLKMIVQPKTEMYKALGGPLSIGSIFPSEWNWEYFWRITALLSVVLAVMNILPIPALDGGHVLFLLVEVVTRRRPSDRFLTIAQTIGMLLLFALMIYATWNDIVRLFIR